MSGAARLAVVGGPEERRDAEALSAAFTAYHGAVHDLKQLEPQLEDLFATLTGSQRQLKVAGVAVDATFGPILMVALERWRRANRHELELPDFIDRTPAHVDV